MKKAGKAKKTADKAKKTAEKAKRLRDELSLYFSFAETRENEARGVGFPVEDCLNGNPAFENAWTAVQNLMRTLLYGDPGEAAVNASFVSTIEEGLTIPFVVRSARWHLREDLTDEEILAAERDILDQNDGALQNLRDPSHETLNCRPTDFQNMQVLVHNLHYLLTVLAHYARACDSFAAGREFLIAADRLQRLDKDVWGTDALRDRVGEVADHISAGGSELAIALDYAALEAWKPYRAREAARNRENLGMGKGKARAKDKSGKGGK